MAMDWNNGQATSTHQNYVTTESELLDGTNRIHIASEQYCGKIVTLKSYLTYTNERAMKNHFPKVASDLISSFLSDSAGDESEKEHDHDQTRGISLGDEKETANEIAARKSLHVEDSCLHDPSRHSAQKQKQNLTESHVSKTASPYPHINIMQEWKPCTTQSLLTTGSRRAMEACSILDHTFGKTFLHDLRAEIHERKLLHRLTPAKTAEDHKVNDLLSSAAGIASSNLELGQSSARGDLSVIIPRSFRSTPKFESQYPFLFHMISSIENTAKKYLEVERTQQNVRIHLNASLTSVQLAMYPGDGKSGYPRHCDTGAACKHESQRNPTNESESETFSAQRIITAVYYVTDDDWLEDDGGCLRIFDNHNDCRDGVKEGDVYHDIIPYADRLVLFRSDLVEHQVLSSRKRPRMAITVWLYGHIVQSDLNSVEITPAIHAHAENAPSPQLPSNKKSQLIEQSMETSCPPLPITTCNEETCHNNENIFVSIPAYRDSETHPTILSLIENASFPDRVYVGVVYQYDTRSVEEHEKYRKAGPRLPSPWESSNLRSITLDYKDATGPCYARYLAQSLHRGEEYILQIDSHMRMRPKWDEYLIQQLLKCEDPQNSILTTYPAGYSLPNYIPNETRATVLVPWKFDRDGMLRQKGRLLHDRDHRICDANMNNSSNDNIPCLLYAAGFNFSASKVIVDCPYDGNLPHLFFGEELSMAVRIYTSGYNCFAPPTAVCYHLWTREHRTTFQADIGVCSETSQSDEHTARRQESMLKVRIQLLGQGHGLGNARDVEQFWERMGIDFNNRQISPDAQNVGLDLISFVTPAPPSSCETDTLIQNVLSVLAL
jgi:[Skp1-protein]-hydroxyproline N-acetylglucosaminyltransferase